jgi:hypothetical protein
MTGMETLISVMEKFGQHGEPEDILIVWTDTNGNVCLKANCSHTQTAGMARYAELCALKILLEPDDEEPPPA